MISVIKVHLVLQTLHLKSDWSVVHIQAAEGHRELSSSLLSISLLLMIIFHH